MDVEDLIRQANPLPTPEAPLGDSPHARRTLDRIRRGSVANGWPRRERRRITMTAAAGIAAAVAIAVALPPAAHGHSGHAGPGAARGQAVMAAVVLRKLALTAAVQPAPVPQKPGPGQYLYTRRDLVKEVCRDFQTAYPDNIGPRTYCLDYVEANRTWTAPNGSGRSWVTYRDPWFPTPYDRSNWIKAGRPSLVMADSRQRFGPQPGVTLNNSGQNLKNLPTNPAKLARLLTSRKMEDGPPGPYEDFVQVGDVLMNPSAPPALRAAIFRVAAGIPGVRYLGTVTGREGIAGVCIAYITRPRSFATYNPHSLDAQLLPGTYQENEIIVNPVTSALLATQTVLVNSRTHASTVTDWSAWPPPQVVDSATSKGTSGSGGSTG